MKTITILDARGLMLWAHHTSPYFSVPSSNGHNLISWQDGLVECIKEIIDPLLEAGIPPQNIIAAWDSGTDYRTKMYEQYKQRRKKRSADQKENNPEAGEQIRLLKDNLIRLLAYLGIKSVHVPGEEADDIVALLCQKLEADHIIVRTVDKDLTMLVSDRVTTMVKREMFHPGNTNPDVIQVQKALVGDGDEYPGIPKFGKQSWARLLRAYGADGMAEIGQALRANDWKPVQAAYDATKDSDLEAILQHWSMATLCFHLAELAPHACFGNYRDKAPKRPVWMARVPNREKVLEILTAIGREDQISKFEHLFPQMILANVSNVEQLVQLGEEIKASPIVSWDYESSDKTKHEPFRRAKKSGTYVDVLSQVIAGVSVNFGKYLEKTVYLPVDHKDTANFPMEWLAWLLQVIDSREEPSVAQNAAFELTVTAVSKMFPEGVLPKAPYDTQIMASYVDENESNRLKDMSRHYLAYHQASYAETTQGRDMCDLTGEETLSYGCDDSLVTGHLFSLFQTIMQVNGSWEFYAANEREPIVNDVLDFVDGQDIDYEELARQAEESRTLRADANSELRDVLRAHSETDLDQAELRARNLFNEWYALDRFKAEGDPEKDKEIIDALWKKAWGLCFYEDYDDTQVEVPTFVSTPTMLNKVIAAIDPEAPPLKRTSAKAVEEFESELKVYTERALPAGTDRSRDERLENFYDRLYAARKRLGSGARDGAAYADLSDFCSEVLTGAKVGKKITTGDELNVNSNPQMQGLLYCKLGLPIRKRSKVDHGSARDRHGLRGGPATGLKAIEAAFVYDLPEDEDDWRRKALMAYRTIALEVQNESLYYAPYPLWAHPRDGKIHPSIRNCGTTTRRPAGNDPNVLQVSKKEGGKIRRIYKAGNYGDGERVVVCADFANQELVITACESRDPVMLDAFMSNPRKDLHSLTSCGYAHILLPRILPPEVTWDGGELDYPTFMAARKGKFGEPTAKAMNLVRNKFSKAVNFLIAYLGGYTTLAGNLLIPEHLAKELMESTFKLYARLAPWQQEVIEFAKTHGYTETAHGTRRHASADLYSKDDFLRTRMERQEVNAVIQGEAACILKEVRQAIVDRKMRERYRMKAVAPVYDEVKASVPLDRVADYCEELTECMEITPPGYPVGMMVELSMGPTWGDQTELEGTSRATIDAAVAALTGEAQ